MSIPCLNKVIIFVIIIIIIIINLFINIVFSFQIIMAKPAGGPKPRTGGNRDDD